MVILYILLVLVLVIIARTLMFTPKAEEPRTYEEIDPDRRAAEDRLSELVRCRTVSYEDASLEDGAEFEKLIGLLPTLYPEVFRTCTLTRLPGRALALSLPAKQQPAPVEALQRAGLAHVRIELGQLADELFKLRV
ncbi:MAG: hypothetical protein IIY43_03530, partial [Oscillospiraceae bacterium]|nr:hypothetical protein [Oscillospiraceae bacterium]